MQLEPKKVNKVIVTYFILITLLLSHLASSFICWPLDCYPLELLTSANGITARWN